MSVRDAAAAEFREHCARFAPRDASTLSSWLRISLCTEKAEKGVFPISARRRRGLVPIEDITRAILVLRGRKVLLDAELASLYGVPTKGLNQAAKRNAERFPADFMFRLSRAETEALYRSQFVTGSQRHRDSRFRPYAFTEHGAIMAATILNSTRAVEMSLYVVRAFIQLREFLASNKDLANRLDALEARIERKLATHDKAITEMIQTIRELTLPPRRRHRGIGFTAKVLGETAQRTDVAAIG